MYLKSFAYKEFVADPKYWSVSKFDLQDINLLVGANASGKTRTLNVISSISKLFTIPVIQFNDGMYEIEFIGGRSEQILYKVEIKKSLVQSEELTIDEKLKIIRGSDGIGEVWSENLSQMMRFKIPGNQLMASRRDELQFPYLEQLFSWSSMLRHFRFAKEQEKNTFTIIDSNQPKEQAFNLKDTDRSIEIFKKGRKEFGDKFIDAIVDDMNRIGYDIVKLDLGALDTIQIQTPIQSRVVGLRLKESDRDGYTDQTSMSDGLFRALSILIHFNFYQMAKIGGCVLIDDIGEGLDYDRSTRLIKIIIDKCIDVKTQILMSTNDKFIMNNTKLNYWQVVTREGGDVRLFNQNNSHEAFEDFKFTGLNNFDFFTTKYFRSSFVK